MDTQKNLLIVVGEWLQARQVRRREADAQPRPPRRLTGWLPSRGNVIFTLLMIALLVAAQTVGALPAGRPQGGDHGGIAPTSTSTGTIAYQGRLADSAGAPLTGTYNMIFRLYDAATGGAPLWEEQWTGPNGVKVSDGLFNVMLGSLTPMPQATITGHDQLFLGITVGTDDEMAPRVQLGSVPFAVQALTVPDGSVTSAKIADGAVTTGKLNLIDGLSANGAITATKIVSSNSTPDNTDLAAGNMGRYRWTITTAGSPLVNWDVEETWMHFGGKLYFVQWTLGKTNNQPNDISVPANSSAGIHLYNWKTQEFASSRFANMVGGSYLTGVSSGLNLIWWTHWGSSSTAVDFVVYNGIGGVDGAVFSLSNPSTNNATVRSFSIQGFVQLP